MLHIDNSFLRSKFARRIFLLFILSAIVPVAVIALLSFTNVATQLREQSYSQSHIACEAIGMELYRRLTVAHEELLAVGDSLRPQLAAHKESPPTVMQGAAPDMAALALISDSGEVTNLRGKIEQTPPLTDEQMRQLALGKTVLQVRINSGDIAADILMIRSIDRNASGKNLLIGALQTEFLWTVIDLLPPASDLLVLDPSGPVLYGSGRYPQSLLAALRPRLSSAPSGRVRWFAGGEANLTTYWSVFTDAIFSVPNLAIVVSQPESTAFAAIKGFSTIFAPLLLLTVLVVSFIAAKQLRKKIAPLLTLRDATQRIASGDFGGRINIVGDDEFAVLGDAFNVMADRLGAQFTSLSTMAEIDRLILSSFDARFIIATVLSRAGELTPCSVAAVLELDNDVPDSGKLSMRSNALDAAIEEIRVQLPPEEIRQLLDNPGHLRFKRGRAILSYVAPLPRDQAQTILVFPTFIKQRVSAVVIFGYSEPSVDDSGDWGALRKFSDHVAVALANAGWEERLYHQAHYDALTNLPNRALLKDRLEQAIARAHRNQSSVGVLFLDLDRFKLVNDSLGHAAGDAVLKKIADTLMRNVRSVDTVVRFGGDEFVIIIPDIDRQSDVVSELGSIAEKIFKATQSEFVIDHQIVHPKISIGIALYPEDGRAPEELIKNADAAMYHAKGKGRARYEFFAPELNAMASHRLKLEQELRRALLNKEFLLDYQPKVDCRSGKLLGAEALIRWRHPERGMIQPLEFIAIAEESGMIRDIGEWVIRTACWQITAWRDAGLAPVRIAVNVSPSQFRENDFTATVAAILDRAKLEPGMLELEITESSVMGDAEEAIGKLKMFRDMGLRLAVDDFGTGYSSLNYLRRLPIHALKIDQSFIKTLSEEHDTRAIVSAAIILAHKLGLEVTAEGVETEEQKQLLQDMQCDMLQGYLIGKPVPAEQFTAQFLRENPGEASADPDVRDSRRTSSR